jgi:hypothetical protein
MASGLRTASRTPSRFRFLRRGILPHPFALTPAISYDIPFSMYYGVTEGHPLWFAELDVFKDAATGANSA